MVCITQKRKERHENEDEREGRLYFPLTLPTNSLNRYRELKRDYQIKEERRAAMKTKTNVKAGHCIA